MLASEIECYENSHVDANPRCKKGVFRLPWDQLRRGREERHKLADLVQAFQISDEIRYHGTYLLAQRSCQRYVGRNNVRVNSGSPFCKVADKDGRAGPVLGEVEEPILFTYPSAIERFPGLRNTHSALHPVCGRGPEKAGRLLEASPWL